MKKVEQKAMEWYVKGKCRLLGLKDRFLHEDKGANTMVEIVVVIALVVVVAGIFREQLMAVVTSAFQQVTEFIGGDGGDAGGVAGLIGR